MGLVAGVLIVGAVVGVSLVTKAIAHRHQPTAPMLQPIPKVMDQKMTPRRLALERYQFVMRLESTVGRPPLGTAGPVSDTVLFPVGRSDRVYYFSEGDCYSSPTGTAILCYQHKGSQDQLIYQVNLEDKDGSATPIPRFKCLLDYLTHYTNDVLPRTVSPLAMRDLSMKRDYVLYTEYDNTDQLFVVRLSQYKNSDLSDDSQPAQYNLDKDPMTKAVLREDEFYGKYGLPIAKGEFSD